MKTSVPHFLLLPICFIFYLYFFLGITPYRFNNEMRFSSLLPTCCFVTIFFICANYVVVYGSIPHFVWLCLMASDFEHLFAVPVGYSCILNSQAIKTDCRLCVLRSGARACQLVGFILGTVRDCISQGFTGTKPPVDAHLFLRLFLVFVRFFNPLWLERMS